MKRNLKLLLAYDGTNFHGWQTQSGLRTVQGELQATLQRVVRHPVDLVASGRTDAGVHAAGQVANFYTACGLDCTRLRHAISCRLPSDISLIRVREVPTAFHATQSALSKLYRYRVFTSSSHPLPRDQSRYVVPCPHELDPAAMSQAARYFVGTQNFKAMASTRGTPRDSYVRTVLCCEVRQAVTEMHIDVRGTGFLYNQVRNMVGTLLEVGRGRWQPGYVREILEGQDRALAGPRVPARGLCLRWVEYPPDHVLLERGLDGSRPPRSAVSERRLEESPGLPSGAGTAVGR